MIGLGGGTTGMKAKMTNRIPKIKSRTAVATLMIELVKINAAMKMNKPPLPHHTLI